MGWIRVFLWFLSSCSPCSAVTGAPDAPVQQGHAAESCQELRVCLHRHFRENNENNFPAEATGGVCRRRWDGAAREWPGLVVAVPSACADTKPSWENLP